MLVYITVYYYYMLVYIYITVYHYYMLVYILLYIAMVLHVSIC